MLTLPLAIASKTEFDQAVSEVVQEMAPDVVYIRHNIAQDWDGDWAVYFRVLLPTSGAIVKTSAFPSTSRSSRVVPASVLDTVRVVPPGFNSSV